MAGGPGTGARGGEGLPAEKGYGPAWGGASGPAEVDASRTAVKVRSEAGVGVAAGLLDEAGVADVGADPDAEPVTLGAATLQPLNNRAAVITRVGSWLADLRRLASRTRLIDRQSRR